MERITLQALKKRIDRSRGEPERKIWTFVQRLFEEGQKSEAMHSPITVLHLTHDLTLELDKLFKLRGIEYEHTTSQVPSAPATEEPETMIEEKPPLRLSTARRIKEWGTLSAEEQMNLVAGYIANELVTDQPKDKWRHILDKALVFAEYYQDEEKEHLLEQFKGLSTEQLKSLLGSVQPKG